jgi:hypothetical protein
MAYSKKKIYQKDIDQIGKGNELQKVVRCFKWSHAEFEVRIEKKKS